MRLDVSASPTNPSVSDKTSDKRKQAEQSSKKIDRESEQIQSHPSTSRSIGHFTIVDRLGAGQFGNVYRARDNKWERDVALKVPKEFLDESYVPFFCGKYERQLN